MSSDILIKMLLSFVIIISIASQIEGLRSKNLILNEHASCRNKSYPGTHGEVIRATVADPEVSWKVPPIHPPYNPPWYTSQIVLDRPEWADPDMETLWKYGSPRPKWNRYNVEGQGYLRQCGAHIFFVNHTYPMNPVGRTGLRGRGLLGRWGPNQQIHIVVARWLKHPNQTIIKVKKPRSRPKGTMEFITIKRTDTRQWAVPGKFHDFSLDKLLSQTAYECFVEDVFNNFKDHSRNYTEMMIPKLKKFFDNAPTVYVGYMDDPRNTDHAWITTHAFVFFEKKNFTRSFIFKPSRDVLDVKWMHSVDAFYKNDFYGGHRHIVKLATEEKNGYYPLTDDEELKKLRKWDSALERMKRRIYNKIARDIRKDKLKMEQKRLAKLNQTEQPSLNQTTQIKLDTAAAN